MAVLGSAVLTGPTGAQTTAERCRLALALAIDVSSSVDSLEYQLQRDGLARALNSEAVRHALLSNPLGWVAIAAYEWSGRRQQNVILPWTAMRSETDISAAAGRIAQTTRLYDEFPTALGYGLGFGATLLTNAPFCLRKTLDMAGDGVNNEGFAPFFAYKHFPLSDVTVNGLVIEGSDAEVYDFYLSEVIHGPGAFLEVAAGYDDFERAMTRKLLREINDIVLGELLLTPDESAD